MAHAKINVFLRVLGRREDGYHEIQSLISPISLADEVAHLEGGRIVGRGTHAELLETSPAYAHLVNAYETEGPAEVGADSVSGRTDGGDR